MTYTRDLQRIIYNYTGSDVTIKASGRYVDVPAGSSLDLALHFDLRDLTIAQDLYDLLDQGVSNFQISDGTNLYNQADGIDLMKRFFSDEFLAAPNKLFYSDAAGRLKEIPFDADITKVLTSTGLSTAPVFEKVQASSVSYNSSVKFDFSRKGDKYNEFLKCFYAIDEPEKFCTTPMPLKSKIVGFAFKCEKVKADTDPNPKTAPVLQVKNSSGVTLYSYQTVVGTLVYSIWNEVGLCTEQEVNEYYRVYINGKKVKNPTCTLYITFTGE
jgi:hypothetical protein